MSRTRWICVHDKDTGQTKFVPTDHASLPERSPYIHTDSMNPVAHPCTGQIMDSKSRFNAETKAHGCIAVGNDPAIERRPIPEYSCPKEDIAEIVNSAYNGSGRVDGKPAVPWELWRRYGG